MKKITYLIMICIIILNMTGCQKEEYSYLTYDAKYHEIMEEYENFMDEGYYIYMVDNLSLGGFIREYNHKNYRNALEEYISVLDNTLYEMTQLALLTDDDKLLIKQSKMEYALEEIKVAFEEFSKHEVNQTIKPNRTALLRASYQMLNQIKGPMMAFYKTREELETYLATLYVGDYLDGYYELKQKNIRRFLYQYYQSIVSTSGLEENTGMHISPMEPLIYREGSNKYMVFEYNLLILTESQGYYSEFLDFLEEENMGGEGVDTFNNILIRAEESLENYVTVRLQYSEGFYRDKEFLRYQKKVRDGQFRNTHDFDYEKYPEMHLDKLRDAYLQVAFLERDENILKFMYTDEEIEASKKEEGDL